MLHGTIKEERVTPRCDPGSVAAERNSFKKRNLKQLYKSKFIDCYSRIALVVKQVPHSKAPDLIFMFVKENVTVLPL